MDKTTTDKFLIFLGGTQIDEPMVAPTKFKSKALSKVIAASVMVSAMTGMSGYNNSIIAAKTEDEEDGRILQRNEDKIQ